MKKMIYKNAEELLDLKAVEKQLMEQHTELTEFVKRADQEITDTKEMSHNTSGKLEELAGQCVKLGDQLAEFEKRMSDGVDDAQPQESLGSMFVKSDQMAALASGQAQSAQITANMSLKTAIINATGQNQPLVPSARLPGIITNPNQVLTVRDLLPTATTSTNLVEYAKENVFTNAAAAQNGENTTKAESAITFTLANAPVATLAHWIPASKQVLSDSPMLQSYIDGRLMYGLKLVEENSLLNATGAAGDLDGLINQADAYTELGTPIANIVDRLRHAILQAHLSNYMPTGIILNPADWYNLETAKVGASDDRYIVGDPHGITAQVLWGMPIVASNSIAADTYLLGAFNMGAQIWDRERASVSVSLENSDNFVKNMATILAEERLALTVYRPSAFITGSAS